MVLVRTFTGFSNSGDFFVVGNVVEVQCLSGRFVLGFIGASGFRNVLEFAAFGFGLVVSRSCCQVRRRCLGGFSSS